MAITNGYATLAQFKQRFAISTTDAARDAELELVIQSASRKIDQFCGRVFYESSTAGATVRYFTATNGQRLYCDDVISITTLKTDDDGDGTIETTWSSSADYWLMPKNTPVGTNWPYLWIQVMPLGSYSFPVDLPNGVEITGDFGWSAVPDEVREACLLISNRVWMRRSSPFGVLGANEFGAPTIITRLDPDIQSLLDPYVRHYL